MLVEAIGKPITYRWPEGEVRLEPGKPVELPNDRARRLLDKAPGKVRVVIVDWLAAWREVAAMTLGGRADDPRMPAIMAAIDRCDAAFAAGDSLAFSHAAEDVRRLCGRETTTQPRGEAT